MEWRKIEGYDMYSASIDGRIRNDVTGKILKPVVSSNGYMVVNLWKNKKPLTQRVHRIIAKAFLPNEDNKPCVNHKDGDKENNKVSNLEWCTYSENETHKQYVLGKKNSTRVANEVIKKAVLCVETGMVFPSITEASKYCGGDVRNVSACLRGKHHTCMGYHWKYAN